MGLPVCARLPERFGGLAGVHPRGGAARPDGGRVFPRVRRTLGVRRSAQRAPALPHLLRHGGGVRARERRRLRPRQRECLLHGRAAGRRVEDHRRRADLAAAHRLLAVPAGRLHRRASDEPQHPVCGHGRLSGLDAPLLAGDYALHRRRANMAATRCDGVRESLRVRHHYRPRKSEHHHCLYRLGTLSGRTRRYLAQHRRRGDLDAREQRQRDLERPCHQRAQLQYGCALLLRRGAR